MASADSRPANVHALLELYRIGEADPVDITESALQRSKTAGSNAYLAQDADWSRREAHELKRDEMMRQPLWGVPVSLKDCFDLRGFVTSCGSKALRSVRVAAREDSAVAARLRASGAVIIGKTHMQQLAYGITGENQDFGDCQQPGYPGLLTGGSSSGAAASIMEGSALAAIGTDTGGSIRVPAALCGLCGYRGSATLGERLWRGGEHLAPSFDTLGWLYRNAADGPLLGHALFGLPMVATDVRGLRVGVPSVAFLHDCEAVVLETLQRWMERLEGFGAAVRRFDAVTWGGAMKIFAPIQASEAAVLHPEPREGFESAIAERLRWGAALTAAEVARARAGLADFRRASEALLAEFDFVLMPCTPVSELRVGEDQSGARAKILRYTTPVSLLGWPAVTLPGGRGAPTLMGKMGDDARLLTVSARIGGLGSLS